MKYLTVGTRELREDLLYKIEDIEDISHIKPRGGLWLTKQYDDCKTFNEWVDYIIENPRILCLKNKSPYIFTQPCSLVTLKEDAKVFNLNTMDKFKELIRKYPYENTKFSYEELSKDYDGIYVDIHGVIRDEKREKIVDQFRRFSIDSLILFNLDCIDYYQSGNIEIEPFDLEFPTYDYYYEINIEDERKRVIKPKTKVLKR